MSTMFTIYGGLPTDGAVTGFMLNLEGREDELMRVIRAVWKEMGTISYENNADSRRLLDQTRGHPIRFFSTDRYDGPTGELHVRRKFP